MFGARGTGKSTWISEHFSPVGASAKIIWIDLLDPAVEHQFALNPNRLVQMIDSQTSAPEWVVIDEVQKVPKLLDLVHSLIEKRKIKFVLSGSSARKLKRGAANLLAGRAFVYNLFPLCMAELGQSFDLHEVLRWGSLPKVFHLQSDREKIAYLNAYVQTYFAEEIRAEQVIRKLAPFRAFLPILGQVSGKIINHKKIGDQVGVSTVTIQSYFQIVEDTLLGFYLPAFHLSVRKGQRLSPKFYVFDNGVKKALEESLEQTIATRTSVYGELLESFLINEIMRLNSYGEKNFRLSYYATKNDVEVDLILSKGQTHRLVEIKSSNKIDEVEVRSLAQVAKSIKGASRVFYISNDEAQLKIGGVECLHWKKFLEIFHTI